MVIGRSLSLATVPTGTALPGSGEGSGVAHLEELATVGALAAGKGEVGEGLRRTETDGARPLGVEEPRRPLRQEPLAPRDHLT